MKQHRYRLLCLLLALLLTFPVTVSCKKKGGSSAPNGNEARTTASQATVIPENDNDRTVRTRRIPFRNLSTDYAVADTEIQTYYVDGNDVPYVSLLQFIQALNGYFNCGDLLKYKYDPNQNTFSLFAYLQSGDFHSRLDVKWDTDTISVSDFNFFYHVLKENQSTDYGAFTKTTHISSEQKHPVTFNIGGYYFDILYYDEKCLVPFVIVNLLFCSTQQYNVYYNGDAYYGYYGEMSVSAKAYRQIYQSSLNGKRQSKAMRIAAVNSLLFAMDYFYGLKEYKEIERFKDYISQDIWNLVWSDNADDNIQGYQNLIYQKLDEIHTRIDTFPIYADFCDDPDLTGPEIGEIRTKFYETRKELLQQQAYSAEKLDSVRYDEDIAIIPLTSFTTGSDAELYDSEGNLKDTAWKYDSYYYMQHCMKQIKKHSGIRTIVLDLSLNGGGNVGAMKRVLGFLSDKVLKISSYDELTGEFLTTSFKVDTDGDGYYDDDAYDQYRWVILSSGYTFSAANTFVSIVKEQNLAKVIGQRTGGGMCSVLPMVLADGTAIAISSNNTYRYVKTDKNNHQTFYAIESGLSPDTEIPYSEFYDSKQLKKYITNIFS